MSSEEKKMTNINQIKNYYKIQLQEGLLNLENHFNQIYNNQSSR